MKVDIVPIEIEDCDKIHLAFKSQGWDKPKSLYERYCEFQSNGTRNVLVAKLNGEFAGYLNINWVSDYLPFKNKSIPEIVDFNVLKKFQRYGIGTQLMDEAEARIGRVSKFAGIGFGLVQDYGAAQILYVKRGYVPDGRGILDEGKVLKYGEKVVVTDNLVLMLVKEL